MNASFKIENKWVGGDHPTYFIADIAANHDGDLQRAKDLIHLAAEAGANAAKFQHFEACKIVSDFGFKDLKEQKSHQAKWDKSVFEVYENASVPRDWTSELRDTCNEAGIHFFSAPYDFDAVDLLDRVGVPAFKIGSGDITWTKMIGRIAQSGKPVLIATGASDISDVSRAMDVLSKYDNPLCLMQCNTNYTGTLENLRHVHLNVLKTYAIMWPDVVLGLSDHTPGHATVLGAVALGARVIEKHFTDDKNRVGPDHAFSMNTYDWREMVERTLELEASLGSTRKFVAENENETVVLQRRCLRATQDLPEGTILTTQHLEALRPAPAGAVMPYEDEFVLGRVLKHAKNAGEHLMLFDVE
ncbi:MAG: N-acetylneuraminate synthase family protein [Desulfobulbaceae bacterium]|nr:N-acetylneuraminate synthase family protein [Desulfobulbaceae bacterium]